jgi:hypothetical protein
VPEQAAEKVRPDGKWPMGKWPMEDPKCLAFPVSDFPFPIQDAFFIILLRAVDDKGARYVAASQEN